MLRCSSYEPSLATKQIWTTTSKGYFHFGHIPGESKHLLPLESGKLQFKQTTFLCFPFVLAKILNSLCCPSQRTNF